MFNELKVGDKVGVTSDNSRSYSYPYMIRTVARTTATQIILDNGKKYKHDGKEVAGAIYSGRLVSFVDAEEHNTRLTTVKELSKAARQIVDTTGLLLNRYTGYGFSCDKGLTQEEKDTIIALVNAL